ncbi:MAG: amidohydrolase family protein, partial [bacterium]|nr:amidohydrolase family protein [bacterium]
QDAGSSFRTVDRIRALAERGELGTRLWIMLNEDNEALEDRIDDYRLQGIAGEQVTVRAIKRSIDGALGSRGAWLLEPYSDLPESTGLNTIPLDELERSAEIALEHGFQLCVHAIGDRGNRETLDIYERAFAQAGERRLRWRIEHAQHLAPTDIPRFAELGVVASMQGVHCTSDGPWVPQRLGTRRSAEGAYRWRDLIDRGVVVSNGTDAPVEDVDPIANFHASVTRKTSEDVRFHPEQRMTRMEALRSMTVNAAYAAFEEDRKGTLEPGKLADVTVLSRDILTAPDGELPDTQVVYTIVGGRVLYDGTTPVDQRLRPIAPR